MSYARFGENSDVYVFAHVDGYLSCCACAFGEPWEHWTTDDMIGHLERHIAAGHQVPDYTIPGLNEDREENDAFAAEMAPSTGIQPPQEAE